MEFTEEEIIKIKAELAEKANWENISAAAKIKQDKLNAIAAKYQEELDSFDKDDFEGRAEVIERMTAEAKLVN